MDEWKNRYYFCHFINEETEAQRNPVTCGHPASECLNQDRTQSAQPQSSRALSAPLLPRAMHGGKQGVGVPQPEIKWEAEAEKFLWGKFKELGVSAQNTFLEAVLDGETGAANTVARLKTESQKWLDMRLMVMQPHFTLHVN